MLGGMLGGRDTKRGAATGGAALSPMAADNDEALLLSVRKGRHQGASVSIDRRHFTIGSSLESDVVLTDRGVAAAHVSITRTGSGLTDRIAVEVLADDVIVGGEAPPPGVTSIVTLPTDIHIADSVVHIEGGQAKATVSTLTKLVPVGIAVGALLGLLVPLLPSVLTTLLPGNSPVLSRGTGEVIGEETLALVRARIAAAGLGPGIEVNARGSAVVVRGQLGEADFGRWRTLKSALIGEGLVGSGLLDLVSPASAGALANGVLAAVVMQPVPTVIGMDGRRAKVGEVLADGWMVKEISGEAVVLERGQQISRIEIPRAK